MFEEFSQFSPLIQTIIACSFTWGVTALGASVVFLFKKINKKVLDGMLGFSAGVMLAASFWSLLSPGIHLAEAMNMNAWLISALGFFSGGLIIFIAENLIEKVNNNKKDNIEKRSTLLIFAITLHNIPEGLVVGVAFGSLIYGIEGATLISAITLAIGIGLQNFPEGCAVSLPLRREGYSRIKSFFYGQLSGVVEPIAGILGVLLVTQAKYLLPFLLCFAAGAMIFVVVEELIPESQKNKDRDIMAIFTMIGFLTMMILDVALG